MTRLLNLAPIIIKPTIRLTKISGEARKAQQGDRVKDQPSDAGTSTTSAAASDPASIPTIDFAVIGGGIAGMTTALRAAEAGIATVLFEQGREARYPCNSRSTGGILHVAYQDIALPPESLAAGVRKAMGDDANDELIGAVSARAGAARDWLLAHGQRFVRATTTVEWHRWTLAPPRPLQPGLDFPGRGGDRLLGYAARAFAALGGQLLLDHAVEAIEREDAGFVITANTSAGPRRYRAKAVAIADGGFQADAPLVARYINPRTERIVQRSAGTGKGLAVRTAHALGLGLSRMDRFYGHPLAREALVNPQLWPYPMLDSITAAAVAVDAQGRRFVDEGRGGTYLANQLTKLDDPASAWVVFDHATWEGPGRESLYPANPHIERGGGTVLRAETLEDLARQMGVDAATLTGTITAYNTAATSGGSALSSLPIPRSGAPRALTQAPFMAIPMAPGITATMGGIRVNGQAQALDTEGRVVPGLYAVGVSSGGLEGGEAVGYVGGLMRGLTGGLIAAEHLATRLGKTVPAARPLIEGSEGGAAVAQAGIAANAAVKAPPRAPALRFLARHAQAFAVCTAVFAALACGGLASLVVAALPALIFALAGGAGGYLVARAFCEMATVILETLVPD